VQSSPALALAFELYRTPSRLSHIRATAVPLDAEVLLRIVAQDEAAIAAAIEASQRPRDVLTKAATFFIEEVLFHSSASHYRVLASRTDAPLNQLRANMVLLMRWLHPDAGNSEDRIRMAQRVTTAWEALKSDDRRKDYDRQLAAAHAARASREKAQSRKGQSLQGNASVRTRGEPSLHQRQHEMFLAAGQTESFFGRLLRRIGAALRGKRS
jgi:hypothetical protein